MPQIVNNGDGTFSLKTNQPGANTTYRSATKSGEAVSTTGEVRNLDFNDVDPMPLAGEEMKVRKEWDDSVNTGHTDEALKFRLLVDGKYYQNDGTKTEEIGDPYVLEANTANSWTDTVDIAPGIVKIAADGTATVYETGHEYKIEEYDITGDVKLWITGYSRGAAVANVIAGRLDTAIANGEKPLGDDIDLTKHGLYCYTFATPTTIQHDDESPIDPRSADYNNIKSVIMYGDVIPKMFFEGLGFERYGIDVTMSDPASENYEEDKVRAMGYYNEFSYQLDTDTYFLDGFTPYRIDLNALLTGGDLISLDPHAPYTDIDQALDVEFNEMSEIMEGRDWYVDNVEGLMTQIYDVICGDDYSYSLDTFINILVRLTMNRGDTHLVNMMMDVLMNKDISDYLIDDIELILTVLERDVAQAADIADGISDLVLLFRGILFSGNSAILNALATIGMNMGFMTYGHIAHTYQSWIWVYDPIHDGE
jgi:hypothetical protein